MSAELPAESEPDRLTALGWDATRDRQWRDAPEGTIAGRVSRGDRGRVVVLTRTGALTATANAAGWSGVDEPVVPTTGDWVALEPPDTGELATVAGVMPRSARIARIDALGRDEQVLATNVDVVFIVHGLDRPLRPGRLERALVVAWDSGATPVVLITKSDLDVDEVDDVEAQIAALAPGVEVHVVSGMDDSGVAVLHEVLDPNRTGVLLGESGAGKSTLVNRLLGAEVQATGEVRGADAKGRHTTVSRDLLAVPAGGVVIDTPGLRGLGLGFDVDEGLALAFADVEDVAVGCRFSDCRHEGEPGCAVTEAVERGELDEARVKRYVALRDESDEADARRDAAAQRERKRQGKVTQRAARAFYRDRGR